MTAPDSSITSCRHCQFYSPEGRRGGSCHKLNVTVHGRWKACSLAIPPFAPSWESLEGIMLWQQKALAMQELAETACVGQSDGTEVAPMPTPTHIWAALPATKYKDAV
ncbi:hypothetical protein [Pantanalinema sp. GBBB05]|uniref:hypothetical protein n=1 Tax=Pantanalinema sp. GBBB05 TaxID=2604139 RepID=UPI001D3ED986|nr:hypothetical protein [Pantanalinema sp. GBBB05]